MPENKKYVTLDQLDRFYKRLTHTDENIGQTPVATFDGVDYYSSWEWDIASIQPGVTFYDSVANEMAYIPQIELENYAGNNSMLRGEYFPPNCAFIVYKQESESNSVMGLESRIDSITSSGAQTINDINYYIQGDFQSSEDGPTTVSHVTVYMGATPTYPLQITEAFNGSIHIDNDPDLFFHHYGSSNLQLTYIPVQDRGLALLAIRNEYDDWFEASWNDDLKINYQKLDTEQNLAQQLLVYYLHNYEPSKIEVLLGNFSTELSYMYNAWHNVSHINDYELMLDKHGILNSNLVLASEPESLMDPSDSISCDILPNDDYGPTALVFTRATQTPLLLTERRPVTFEFDEQNVQFIYTNDGKPHVTIRMTESSNPGTESRSIAPTVTFHYDGPQFEAGIDGSLPTMLPDTAPANLNAIFSEDGWDLAEYWNDDAYGITGADGCCTLRFGGRFGRVVDIWGPCTLYYDLYDPNAL